MAIDFAGTRRAGRGQPERAARGHDGGGDLRAARLVGEPIPLNGGCLAPVELRIPGHSLLDARPGAAVCGGNVETSQRIVDVLLGALGRPPRARAR